MRLALEGLDSSQGFLIGSLIGGALGFASVYYCCSQLDSFLVFHKKKSRETGTAASRPGKSLHEAFEDEILSEQFTRNVQFFGSKGQQQVHDAFVVVVGLGVSITNSFYTPLFQSKAEQRQHKICASARGESCEVTLPITLDVMLTGSDL